MGCGDEGCVVVPASQGAALEMSQAEAGCRFAVVVLNAPSYIRQANKFRQRCRLRQGGRATNRRRLAGFVDMAQEPRSAPGSRTGTTAAADRPQSVRCTRDDGDVEKWLVQAPCFCEGHCATPPATGRNPITSATASTPTAVCTRAVARRKHCHFPQYPRRAFATKRQVYRCSIRRAA